MFGGTNRRSRLGTGLDISVDHSGLRSSVCRPDLLVAGGRTLVLFLMRYRSIPVDVCWVIAGGVAAFLALISPPSLRRWRLIGEHRIGRTLSDNRSTFVTAGGP